MPYTKKDPPDAIRGFPKHGQEIWISAFNFAWEAYKKDESKAESREAYANSVAWAAVKKAGYVKKDNKWTKEAVQMKDILQEKLKELEEVGKKLSKASVAKLKKIKTAIDDLLSSEDIDKVKAEAAVKDADKLIQEAKERKPVELIESRQNVLELTEEEGKAPTVMGTAIEAGAVGENGTRYAKETVLKPAIQTALKEGLTGYIGHPKGEPTFSDVGVKITDLWFEGNDLKYKGEVVDTTKGKDLLACARAQIPIKNSIRGFGDFDLIREKGDMVKEVAEGFKLASIDFIAESPAFAGAGMESFKEQKGNKEEEVELKELNEKIQSLEKKLDEAAKKPTLSDEDMKLFKEQKALYEAQAKVKEILESKDVTEDDLLKKPEVVAILERHLKDCKTPEEVDTTWPHVRKLVTEMYKPKTEPGTSIVVGETRGMLGGLRQRFNNIEEAYNFVTDVKDTGEKDDKSPYMPALNNPKFILERLVNTYLIEVCKLESPFENSRRNPLRLLTEAAGDDETYTGDVAAGNVMLLPVFRAVFEDLYTMIKGMMSFQPLDRPAGKVFFLDWLYEDTGADPRVSAAVDDDYADKAEDAEGANLSLEIVSNDLSLDTAKKLKARATMEIVQDLRAYHKLNFESEAIMAMKDEIIREIASVLLTGLETGSSCTNSDNCVTAGDVGFSLTPDAGCSERDWWTYHFAKAVENAALLVWNARHVNPNFMVIDGATGVYMTTMPRGFKADDVIPSNFGIEKIGTFVSKYKVYKSATMTANKVLLGYQGTNWYQTGYVFLPYILFYLHPTVYDNAPGLTKNIMSRFGKQKVLGKLFATVTLS